MEIQKILDYVTRTPENTNTNYLRGMLQAYVDGGGSEPQTIKFNTPYDPQTNKAATMADIESATGSNTKAITEHIEDSDIHITAEERKKWNAMASGDGTVVGGEIQPLTIDYGSEQIVFDGTTETTITTAQWSTAAPGGGDKGLPGQIWIQYSQPKEYLKEIAKVYICGGRHVGETVYGGSNSYYNWIQIYPEPRFAKPSVYTLAGDEKIAFSSWIESLMQDVITDGNNTYDGDPIDTRLTALENSIQSIETLIDQKLAKILGEGAEDEIVTTSSTGNIKRSGRLIGGAELESEPKDTTVATEKAVENAAGSAIDDALSWKIDS